MGKLDKSKIIMLIINVISVIVTLYHNYIYQTTGYKMVLKVTCSAMFATLGLINLIYSIIVKQKNINFYICMSIGLILACLGDYFILYDFVKGALSFALGHIFFIIAYCFIRKMKRIDVIISLAIFSGCMIYLLCLPSKDFDNQVYKIVSVIYALIISFMAGKAIGNSIKYKNIATIMISLASMLFLFSDLMLVLGALVNTIKWASVACLSTYYPALCFLAFSMLLMNICESKEYN